jgi:hypothetical protein
MGALGQAGALGSGACFGRRHVWAQSKLGLVGSLQGAATILVLRRLKQKANVLESED